MFSPDIRAYIAYIIDPGARSVSQECNSPTSWSWQLHRRKGLLTWVVADLAPLNLPPTMFRVMRPARNWTSPIGNNSNTNHAPAFQGTKVLLHTELPRSDTAFPPVSKGLYNASFIAGPPADYEIRHELISGRGSTHRHTLAVFAVTPASTTKPLKAAADLRRKDSELGY